MDSSRSALGVGTAWRQDLDDDPTITHVNDGSFDSNCGSFGSFSGSASDLLTGSTHDQRTFGVAPLFTGTASRLDLLDDTQLALDAQELISLGKAENTLTPSASRLRGRISSSNDDDNNRPRIHSDLNDLDLAPHPEESPASSKDSASLEKGQDPESDTNILSGLSDSAAATTCSPSPQEVTASASSPPSVPEMASSATTAGEGKSQSSGGGRWKGFKVKKGVKNILRGGRRSSGQPKDAPPAPRDIRTKSESHLKRPNNPVVSDRPHSTTDKSPSKSPRLLNILH
jgi:hypothetical protein